MTGRRSLRTRVLVAMIVPAVGLLAVLFFLFDRVETGSAREASVQQAQGVARIVAAAYASQATSVVGAGLFRLLVGDSQLRVFVGDRQIYRSGPDVEAHRFMVTSPFPGGRVQVVGDIEDETAQALRLTGIAAGVIVVLVIVGLIGSTTLARGVRRPIEQAVVVADRLAGGDLSVRMASDEPGQFARLARAFNGMADRLQRADRDQERFLADVAHEIATPVNAVIGLAGTAIDRTYETPAQRVEAAELLSGEADRLRTLLADLRALARSELPETVRTEPFDLAALVLEVERRFKPVAAERGLDLGVEARPTTVRTDGRFVERIVTNLVTNAIRYTASGGRIDIEVRSGTDTVAVAVRDTGIGIAAEEAERIFDRFYRVGEARDRESGGTGLGLSIARRAAMAIGGRIELDSTPGAGSEFRLLLPVTA